MSHSLKLKILSITLIALIIMTMGTMSFATEETLPQLGETVAEEKEAPRLNTKIKFTGDTYLFYNGGIVRKSYKDGKEGCGIVSIIMKGKKYGVYVTGEGWISEDQIVNTEEYITLEFNTEDIGKNGIASVFKINGEYINVESTNNSVIKYENGELVVNGNGQSTVTFTTEDGKEIEALATVVDGGVTLNIPEKEFAANVSSEVNAGDKIKVEMEGNSTAKIDISSEGIGVSADGDGSAKLTVDDKEIASAEGGMNAHAAVGKDGAEAGVEAHQSASLLERLIVKLTGHAEASASREEAEASAGGKIEVNDEEVVSGEVGTSHEYSKTDPEIGANAKILGKDVINVQDQTLPITSLFKTLITKIH